MSEETFLPLTDLLLSFSKEYESGHSLECRFQHCNATTAETTHYIYLRSYRTIVAIYDTRNNVLYDILRPAYGYTATSAQHIAKFRNYLRILNMKYPVLFRYNYSDSE